VFCSNGPICTHYVNMFLQVNNTDAEGRLTLADALVYACKQGVEKVMSCLFRWHVLFI
jgi:leucyl aminopeptidase